MMRTYLRLMTCACIAALALACSQPQPTPDETTPAGAVGTTTAIVDREWQLVAFGDGAPLGATARPVTLRLDAATGRAAGYAGCNGYGGAYTLNGTGLSFGAMAMTRMACAEGMAVEQRYAAMLPSVTTYTVRDTTLELHGAGGLLATFRPR